MKYVYLLESVSSPGQRYIGLTDNVEKRLRTHNAGGSPHTFKFKPWRLTARGPSQIGRAVPGGQGDCRK